MATLAISVLKSNVKQDKTYNVTIRLTHKRKSVYIKTNHYVVKEQLNKAFKLKDTEIIDELNEVLKTYRSAISKMKDLPRVDVQTVKSRLLALDEDLSINFTAFIRDYIKKLEKKNKSTAATFVTVLNSLNDYFKRDIDITEINYKFLLKYEEYRLAERKITRGGNKASVTFKKPGTKTAHNHMRDLRLLFNAARDHYNNEDTGEILIKHYPFKKYKVGQAPETEKRGLEINKIKAIRDMSCDPGSRAELARDLFMLSFYLCGMNAADMYELKPGLVSRVDYYRKKVRNRRKDKGFISVKLIPEAKDLYLKYAGSLQEMYTSAQALDYALAKGMPEGIDFYSARHSFGDLARNVCRFSKDDVGLALNHKDRSNLTTDIYVSKNWDIVDEVQAAVVALLK